MDTRRFGLVVSIVLGVCFQTGAWARENPNTETVCEMAIGLAAADEAHFREVPELYLTIWNDRVDFPLKVAGTAFATVGTVLLSPVLLFKATGEDYSKVRDLLHDARFGQGPALDSFTKQLRKTDPQLTREAVAQAINQLNQSQALCARKNGLPMRSRRALEMINTASRLKRLSADPHLFSRSVSTINHHSGVAIDK